MKSTICLIILICIVFTGCSLHKSNSSKVITTDNPETIKDVTINWSEIAPTVNSLDDTILLDFIEDSVYMQLIEKINDDNYVIERVDAIYLSKEYLEEKEYNSKENIFFGYSLSDIDSFLGNIKYIFTLSDDNQTIIQRMNVIPEVDYFNKIVKNVAIGAGVILVCVVVSAVTGGAGAPAAAAIFACSAKTATVAALSGGLICGLTTGIVRGYQTEDFNESLKAASLSGSEAFKWGAVGGAISGGVKEALVLKSATAKGLTMNQVAKIQKESGYPLSLIRQFHSEKEYEVFKQAGLQTKMIGGRLALVRDNIDLYNTLDEYGRNNFTRMSQGLNPIDKFGDPFEWHHIGQENDGTLALLTKMEHDNENLHGFKVNSEIDRVVFEKYKRDNLNKSLLNWLISIKN